MSSLENYILSIDQGTTSSRAIAVNRKGEIAFSAQQEFRQSYPRSGWVEHDPEEIWQSVLDTAREVIRQAGGPERFTAIGITNQRETAVVWERGTGRPVYPAIVWQDRRTSDYCNELRARGKEGLLQEKTGLVIDAYFSASKIRWILEEVEGARELAENGALCAGTVDSWLLWKLSGGKDHLTDITNASRTQLFNIHSLDWDAQLLELFEIPEQILPRVVESSTRMTQAVPDCFGMPIPVSGIAGDQQAALFGQLCFEKGMVKNTYGTGCFMLMNIGSHPHGSRHQLLTTIAWSIGGKVTYALEGSIFIAGAVVQWLRDELRFFDRSEEVEALATQVSDTEGVYVVPAFAGLGAPHWKQEARGMVTGLTRGSGKAHIARAALESIAYQTMDVLQCMEADSGLPIRELRVDGGATVNDLIMQFQSDILQCQIQRPAVLESTAMGAAYLAGLAEGFWKDLEEIKDIWAVDRQFTPRPMDQDLRSKIKGWKRAVDAALFWSNT